MKKNCSPIDEIFNDLVVFPVPNIPIIKQAVDQDKMIIAKTITRLPIEFQKDAKKALFFIVNNQVTGIQQNISITRKFNFEELENGYQSKHCSAIKEQDGFVINFHKYFIVLNFTNIQDEDKKMDLAAHEIAHMFIENGPDRGKTEQTVDDLVESWGFKRSYKYYKGF